MLETIGSEFETLRAVGRGYLDEQRRLASSTSTMAVRD
jgi:hypothetical protein